MGKAKEVVYFGNRLRGKLLSEEICRKLEMLRQVDRDKNYVADLKNIIYDLSPSDVDIVKQLQTNEAIGVDIRKGELTNLQTVGVAYMYFAKNLVLGDSVGLGKTVEVCGLCNLLEVERAKEGYEFRFLYLTSKNLLSQAQDEFIRFTANYVETLEGYAKPINNFYNDNINYIKHSVVGAHSLINSEKFQEFLVEYERRNGCSPFDLLIVDESGDILTNSTTKTYKNAQVMREMFERVILLNATPFEKDLRMFYNQIHLVDETLLPTKSAFSKEFEIMSYAGAYPVFSGKYKNQDKFREMVGYRYLARTRKSSGAKMVDCTAEVKITPLSSEQKELLKKTSMPQMVYDCPSYFGLGVPSDEYTTPKLHALMQLITKEWADVPSILIYSRYKEAQACIQETLSNYNIESWVLNGESSQAERENIINGFKLGLIRVLITNVQKGLNFGNCNHCIFYSYDPNPNKMVQLEGRITRSYDIINKHVVLLLSQGKELKSFKSVIADRAKASDVFAGSDFSCVLSILLNDEKLADLK